MISNLQVEVNDELAELYNILNQIQQDKVILKQDKIALLYDNEKMIDEIAEHK